MPTRRSIFHNLGAQTFNGIWIIPRTRSSQNSILSIAFTTLDLGLLLRARTVLVTTIGGTATSVFCCCGCGLLWLSIEREETAEWEPQCSNVKVLWRNRYIDVDFAEDALANCCFGRTDHFFAGIVYQLYRTGSIDMLLWWLLRNIRVQYDARNLVQTM